MCAAQNISSRALEGEGSRQLEAHMYILNPVSSDLGRSRGKPDEKVGRQVGVSEVI